MSKDDSASGSERPDPEDYPSEETIFGVYDSIEAAGFSIVDEKGHPITAEELRVNLYDHWGILEDGDGYDDVRFALDEMGEVARSLHTDSGRAGGST